jgi:glycosyltransferase involved in cell wall biosynthesis
MSGPLVSILTPSLNQARFLDDCIQSVVNQTYPSIEQVIFDGGSTDETLKTLRRAPTTVRWTSEPDRGQAHALNKALDVSRGTVIGWVNSDDAYADRRAVSWAVDVLERDESVDVVFGHALLINEENLVLQAIWTPPMNMSFLRLSHYIYQPTLFMRRRALEKQPVFLREDLGFVFDRELLLRLARSARFHRLTKVLSADRHQRARKVETAPYFEEAVRFDSSIGISSGLARSLGARAFKASVRLAGVALTTTLPSTVDPAIDLRWPIMRERIRLQVATSRRAMPFEG